MVVLNLVQSQIRSIQSIYASNTEIQLLERALWQDFNTYRLSYNSQNNRLKCVSEIDSVFYMFKNNMIVRNKDTLNLTIEKTTFYLEGDKVNAGTVDALEIQLSKNTVNKKRFIFKNKDATHYMQ